MPSDPSHPPVVVLCPMRIERDAVAAALRRAALFDAVLLIQTGVGKHAILKSLDRVLAARPDAPPTAVLLAGACGGLTHTDPVPPIAAVIDTHSNRWVPPLAAEPDGVTLVAVDHVVATPHDKHVLAQSTGACIVDMESHAFARRCAELDLAWGVVRGVSDTPDETLPGEVLNWITPEGNTRSFRAARDLALRPSLIPHIASVLKRSRRVLPLVGERVAAIANSIAHPEPAR